MARRCIFCNQEGKLSREHALPIWFAKLFGAGTIFDWAVDSEKGRRKLRGSGPLNIVTRTVCSSCNSGWMSRLEAKAAPILTPLIAGQRTSLTADSLNTIALWCIKTALVYASLGEIARPQVVDADAQFLYTHQQPPPHCVVYLGGYVPNAAPAQAAKVIPRRLDMVDPTTATLLDAIYDWTAALGNLLIKVVLLPQMLWNRQGTIEFPEPRPLVPICPVPVATPYEWPPAAGTTRCI